MLEFVPQTGNRSRDQLHTRQQVRSQAMRDYRRRQREESSGSDLVAPTQDACSSWKQHRRRSGLESRSKPSCCSVRTARETNTALPQVDHDASGDATQMPCFSEFIDTPSGATGLQAGPWSLHELHSSDLCRKQIRQAFIHSYFSENVLSSNKRFIEVYQLQAPTGNAMEASHDALCLIHLGSRFQDERLLMAGRLRYCDALRFIREVIERPGAAMDDCLLGACYTVAHCEIFKVISQDGKGWQLHMKGLYCILRKRGPQSITSPFAQAMFHNIRQIAVMDQLLTRKKTFLSSPSWLASATSRHYSACELTDIALQISETVERAYRLYAMNPFPADEASEVSAHMAELDSNLCSWLDNFRSVSGTKRVPCKLDAGQEYSSFQQRCGDLADVFPTAFNFSTFLAATSHVYVWICRLVLLESLAKIQEIPLSSSPNALTTTRARADECANNLCRTLPFLSSGQHSSAGILACGGPLHFAAVWFERNQNWPKLRWCERVRDFLEHDALGSEGERTALNLQRPALTWWMLPSLFSDG